MFQRVPYPDHPDRCQGLRGQQGQCWNFRQGESKFCEAHGGNRANEVAQKEERTLYEANKYLTKMAANRNHPDLLSLTNEVAALKSIIDAKLNMIQDEKSFLQYHGAVADLLMKSEKLVASCARLKEKLGMMMSAEQALAFASEIQQIVQEEVKDHDALQRIQERISSALARW